MNIQNKYLKLQVIWTEKSKLQERNSNSHVDEDDEENFVIINFLDLLEHEIQDFDMILYNQDTDSTKNS